MGGCQKTPSIIYMCSYFVSSVRLCSLMLTMTQYIKEEGSCKRTKFALMLTFLQDKLYYHLSVKDYTGLDLQWCPLFKWMLTTFHTFGTICLRKHIFWMSIASDWSLKDRIPIFVLHIKIKLYEIHFYCNCLNKLVTSFSRFPLHCGLFLSQLPAPFHVGEDDEEDGVGQDDVDNQKDGMERRQMRPLMYL